MFSRGTLKFKTGKHRNLLADALVFVPREILMCCGHDSGLFV